MHGTLLESTAVFMFTILITFAYGGEHGYGADREAHHAMLVKAVG
jgi:hypothetical protein